MVYNMLIHNEYGFMAECLFSTNFSIPSHTSSSLFDYKGMLLFAFQLEILSVNLA